MKITEITAKSIIQKSGLPGADFVVNPYSGCGFGCSYCYADFMRKFTGHQDDTWGDYVDVKVNTVELFEKELSPKLQTPYSILFSSVTDPYQGVEAKYKLTRQCLEIAADQNFSGELSILTKSPLVTRDIDILQKLRNVSIGLTVTTTDDSISRLLEKHAPTASARLHALRLLNDAGIETYACINPLLPHFTSRPRLLRELFDQLAASAVRKIWIEHLNLSWNKRKRLREEIGEKVAPEVMDEFMASQKDEYQQELESMVYEILDDYDFEVQGGGVIRHGKSSTE